MAEKCKKCGKELPYNHNDDLCGYCKEKYFDNVKKGAGIAGGILAAIGTVVSFLLFKK